MEPSAELSVVVKLELLYLVGCVVGKSLVTGDHSALFENGNWDTNNPVESISTSTTLVKIQSRFI